MARRKKRAQLRKRKPRARRTTADYMNLRKAADLLAGDKSRWPERLALLKEGDKLETELLRRGEYHRRRSHRGKR